MSKILLSNHLASAVLLPFGIQVCLGILPSGCCQNPPISHLWSLDEHRHQSVQPQWLLFGSVGRSTPLLMSTPAASESP